MKNILIVGASGHSKMIIDIIHKNKNYNIIGLVDSFKKIGDIIYNYKIIGKVTDVEVLRKELDVYGVVIGIGDNITRKSIKEQIQDVSPKLEFISVIHPSAILTDDIFIPQGTTVMAGVIINADAKIGEFCILNTNSSLGHDSTMANFSSLASGSTIGGNVNIGFCSAICLKASIIHNVNIGNHTVIGAGALVLKSIGDYKQAVGVPIDKIKDRKYNSKYLG